MSKEKFCSSSKTFRFQINRIKCLCPSFTRNSFIKQLKTSPKKVEKEKDDRKNIWMRLPYLGNIGDSLKNCFKKVQKCLQENVCFITCYEIKKTAVFCSAKDSIPTHQKANVSYKFTCPGCN